MALRATNLGPVQCKHCKFKLADGDQVEVQEIQRTFHLAVRESARALQTIYEMESLSEGDEGGHSQGWERLNVIKCKNCDVKVGSVWRIDGEGTFTLFKARDTLLNGEEWSGTGFRNKFSATRQAGHVTRILSTQGYAFIDSQKTKGIYFRLEHAPQNIKVGDKVEFDLIQKPSGKPKARQISIRQNTDGAQRSQASKEQGKRLGRPQMSRSESNRTPQERELKDLTRLKEPKDALHAILQVNVRNRVLNPALQETKEKIFTRIRLVHHALRTPPKSPERRCLLEHLSSSDCSLLHLATMTLLAEPNVNVFVMVLRILSACICEFPTSSVGMQRNIKCLHDLAERTPFEGTEDVEDILDASEPPMFPSQSSVIRAAEKLTERVTWLVERIEQLDTKKDVSLPPRIAPLPDYDTSGFRYIPKEPTPDELRHPVKGVRKMETRFETTEAYLDLLYRLMREDLIRPLRDELDETQMKESPTNADWFRNVTINKVNAGRHGRLVVHEVHFRNFSGRLTKADFWKSCKKFKFGNLLLFSQHSFRQGFPVLFATVANTEPAQLAKGLLQVIFLDPENDAFDPFKTSATFDVIESPAFFEAYTHTLEALKSRTEDQLSQLTHDLAKGDDTQRLPAYLDRLQGITMDFSTLFDNKIVEGSVEDIDNILAQEGCLLDESQRRAFKLFLSHEIPLVQGPPGTGKSFVAKKMLAFLLANKEQILRAMEPEHRHRTGDRGLNILLLGLTNHAVDQLCGALLHEKLTSNVVRLGSQSKSEQMEALSLSNQRRTQRRSWKVGRARNDLKMAVAKLISFDNSLREYSISPFPAFDEMDSDEDVDSPWRTYTEWSNTVPEELADQEAFRSSHDKKAMEKWLGIEEFEEDEVQQNEREEDGWKKQESKKTQLRKKKQQKERRAKRIAEIMAELGKPFSSDEKIEQLRNWRQQFETRARERLRKLRLEERTARLQLEEEEQRADHDLLRGKDIVAATMNGAARNLGRLQKLRPTIVIVEEAAEVLEPHIIACLEQSVEHLILLGDHKQLQPKTADYFVGRDFLLGRSLFERLVDAKHSQETLATQRRMHPEISHIVRSLGLYKLLEDGENVKRREPVRGLDSRVWFLSHAEKEDSLGDMHSKSNKFEAEFVVRLAIYLLQQGYQASQIAILTPYVGQIMCIREFRGQRHKSIRGLKEIKVASVDDVQGEEYDVVILSLVRSGGHSIGFLRTENRINVALSRAKAGLYVFGNFQHLGQKSKTWDHLMDTLNDKRQLGGELTLSCANHSCDRAQKKEKTFTKIKAPQDFDMVMDGGCERMCRARLNCGHTCPQKCHTSPHDISLCTAKCNKKQDKCEHLCDYDCGSCTSRGSHGTCRTIVSRRLDCGHDWKGKCGETNPTCTVQVTTTLGCGHELTSTCCYARSGNVTCTASCTEVLRCGHRCPGECETCFSSPDHQPCTSPCGRPLICGHECSTPCSTSCPPCSNSCNRFCEHNRCNKTCREICQPCMEPCSWSCPHFKCSKPCSEVCDRERCNEQCVIRLSCGHPCIGLCGEPCPKLCRTCNADEIVLDEVYCPVKVGDVPEDQVILELSCGCANRFIAMGAMDSQTKACLERKEVTLLQCPSCRASLWDPPRRYKKEIQKLHKTMDEIKLRTLEDQKKLEDVVAQVIDLASDVREPILPSKERLARFPMQDLRFLHCCLECIKMLKSEERMGGEIPSSQRHLNRDLNDLVKRVIRNQCDPELKGILSSDDKLDVFINQSLYLTLSANVLSASKRTGANCLHSMLQARKLAVSDKPGAIRVLEQTYHAMCGQSEVKSIIAALEHEVPVSNGHWYRCKCGELYTIGECGGAMEESNCPSCKAIIGGRNHTLTHGSNAALDLPGASRQAYMWDDGTGQGAAHRHQLYQ